MWTLVEQDALRKMLSSNNPLRSALEKLCQEKARERLWDACSALCAEPRQYERAADYAVKAAMWGSLMRELEHEVNKQDSSGPTAQEQ
jgi:hypothetical protein